MESITPRAHASVHETPQATDSRDAANLWRALLPTWTDPAAARVRNVRRLAAALRNPRAVAQVAERLERQTEGGPR